MSFRKPDFSEVPFWAERWMEQPRSVLCHKQLRTYAYLTLGNGTRGLRKFSRSVWVKPADSGHGPSQANFSKIQLFRLLFSKALGWSSAAAPKTAVCVRKAVTAEGATSKPAPREDSPAGHPVGHLPCTWLQRHHCNFKRHCGIQKF